MFRDHHRHGVRLSIRTMPLADPEAVARLQARIAAATVPSPSTELSETAIALRDARFRAAVHFALSQPTPRFLRRTR